MISSASSSAHANPAELVRSAAGNVVRQPSRRPDQISLESAAFLDAELVRQPEIRPEVVERAQALAARPDYPPFEIMREVAQHIVGAPDLSELEG